MIFLFFTSVLARAGDIYIGATVLSTDPCTVVVKSAPFTGAQLSPEDPKSLCNSTQKELFIRYTVKDGESTQGTVYQESRNTATVGLIISSVLIGFILSGPILMTGIALAHAMILAGYIVSSGGSSSVFYLLGFISLILIYFSLRYSEFKGIKPNSLSTTIASAVLPIVLSVIFLYLPGIKIIDLLVLSVCIILNKLLQKGAIHSYKNYLFELLNSSRFFLLFILYYSIRKALIVEYTDSRVLLSEDELFNFLTGIHAILAFMLVVPLSFFKIKSYALGKKKILKHEKG
jgi:hypothetical protein